MWNNEKTNYCWKVCPSGKAFFDELMKTSESAFDMAFDFDEFRKKCYEDCPHQKDRDWGNPDGIEWWKLKNAANHCYTKDISSGLIGDIMTIERYRSYIKNKLFIPSDGMGYYCAADEMLYEHTDFSVEEIDKKIEKGYKYVIWCNK